MKIELSEEILDKMWREFDFINAEYELLDLQRQLTKAAYAKNYQAVMDIQQCITMSLSAKVLAVRQVSSNFTTHGVDGVQWKKDSDKMRAAMSLTNVGYKAKPARHIAVYEKFGGRERRFSIHTLYDKAMQVLYAFALEPVAEAWADFKSFAFRKGRSALDAHAFLMKTLNVKGAPEYILCADIKSCYNSISHDWLLKHIPMDKHVLVEFLNAGYVFAGELFPTEQGISLGSNFSPVLGNMTLDGMRSYIYKRLYGDGEIDYDNGNMIRFADDIIVMLKTENDAKKVKEIVSDFLAPRGLILSPQKTRIVNVSEGFDFLGRNYINRNGVMCATPSKKSIAKFEQSLNEAILGHKGSQKALIDLINQKLIGWANYHRVSNATEAFRHIDIVVQTLLLQASAAKHPKLSINQVIDKYWYKDINNHKIYALPSKKECHVIEIGHTVLIDHKPARLEPNSYLDSQYFSEREENRAVTNVTGDFKAIWERQGGKCHFCGKPILADQARKLVQIGMERGKAIKNLAYVHTVCVHDEIIYCPTEKSVNSLTQLDIITMLDDLADNKSKSKQKLQPAYKKLQKYFLTQTKPTVTLTFKQIEEIIDKPLAASAYKNSSYWYKTEDSALSKAWTTQGYTIQNLSMKNKKITLRQSDCAKTHLVIPEVFLNSRIPNDAKFEIESFFKYIRKKYGI